MHIEPLETRSFSIPVSRIAVENLGEGYEISYGERVVILEVTGPESETETLTADDVKLTLNAGGLSAGEHEVALASGVDAEHCWVSASPRVPITLEGGNTQDGATGQDAQENAEGQTPGTAGDGTP